LFPKQQLSDLRAAVARAVLCAVRRGRWSRTPLALALTLAAIGCAYETGSVEIPDADTRRFAAEVYPILLADCGFPACHGSGERPLSVYGPGRTRLDPELDAYAPATAEEVALSYARARSMLVDPDGPRRAPLLRKPLAVEAGGAEHGGDDAWGNAVFETKRDPRFEALFFWAIGEDAQP
jgi:hypothetical protein